jgi:transcriptional regulator with XRE-family HTH domain
VNSKDTLFFKALGARIAQARKDQNVTQQQLADQLGIAQQTLGDYEAGRLRLPASMLPHLGQILGLSPAELLGYDVRPKLKPGPTSRLEQQFESIRRLTRTKQNFVMNMLDAFIASQAGH